MRVWEEKGKKKKKGGKGGTPRRLAKFRWQEGVSMANFVCRL